MSDRTKTWSKAIREMEFQGEPMTDTQQTTPNPDPPKAPSREALELAVKRCPFSGDLACVPDPLQMDKLCVRCLRTAREIDALAAERVRAAYEKAAAAQCANCHAGFKAVWRLERWYHAYQDPDVKRAMYTYCYAPIIRDLLSGKLEPQ